MNKTVRKQTTPGWLGALFFLLAVIGAFLVVSNISLDIGRWAIGAGVFIFLVIYVFLSLIYAAIHNQIERKNFEKYLASLPLRERMAAIDERFGGMLKKLTATPEYKQAEEEFRRKFEKRLKPILSTLEAPGPLSFSAQNQLETEIKKLEKELGAEKASKTGRE